MSDEEHPFKQMLIEANFRPPSGLDGGMAELEEGRRVLRRDNAERARTDYPDVPADVGTFPTPTYRYNERDRNYHENQPQWFFPGSDRAFQWLEKRRGFEL